METVPREVTKVDYYAIEHIKKYIPEVIPETTIETVPVERIVQRTEYIPVEKKTVRYPQAKIGEERHVVIDQREVVVGGGFVGGSVTTLPTQTIQTVTNPTIIQGGRVSTVGRVSAVGGYTTLGGVSTIGGVNTIGGGVTTIGGGLSTIGGGVGVNSIGSSNLVFPQSYQYTTAPVTSGQTITTVGGASSNIIGQPLTTYTRV